MYGQQWLRQAGLEPGRDYEVKAARTDLGVGRMLLTGEAVAAVLSNGEFRVLPPEESARMKVVEVIARVPNFIIMAHPRIERERLARLKGELKSFLADKDEGEPFAKATGFTAIIDADEALLRELDPYAALTRRAMGVSN
jgi:phosphonate transport system substrate-binding protein